MMFFACLFNDAPCEIETKILPLQNCFQTTALNEALKQEVERLKIATGESTSASDSYNFGMHHYPFAQSSFYQPQQGPNNPRHVQMPQFHPNQSNMLNHRHSLLMASQSQVLSEMQGLDINARGSHLVKSEAPSISPSESTSFAFWSKWYQPTSYIVEVFIDWLLV